MITRLERFVYALAWISMILSGANLTIALVALTQAEYAITLKAFAAVVVLAILPAAYYRYNSRELARLEARLGLDGDDQ